MSQAKSKPQKVIVYGRENEGQGELRKLFEIECGSKGEADRVSREYKSKAWVTSTRVEPL